MGASGRRLSFTLTELGGALGDLGVFIPIATALILTNGFDATAVFLVFGVAYVGTGLYYQLPMPVQPLKAMAAIAIAQGLSPDVVSAAGLLLGLLLLGLAATGAIVPLSSLFPKPIVRGIQAAVGLLLLQAGLRLVFDPHLVRGGDALHLDVMAASMPAGLVLAAGLACVLALGLVWRRVPVTLLVLVPAVAVGALFGGPADVRAVDWGPQTPAWGLPDPSLLWTAFVLLVVPQLPLTLGNAVIACRDTAQEYFQQDAARVTQRALLTTKGAMNVVAGLMGGIPVCHGAGGLTAHYTFGARTGGATVMLGSVLIVLALTLGSGAAALLGLVPLPALGLLLCVVGVQHALLVRDTRPGLDWAVVGTVAGVAFATGNIAIGFGAGIAVHQAGRLGERVGSGIARSGAERVRKARRTFRGGHSALTTKLSDR